MAKKNTDFINPFETGVTYAQFLEAIPEGTSIKDYLSGKDFTDADIAWIEEEIICYKNNNSPKKEPTN